MRAFWLLLSPRFLGFKNQMVRSEKGARFRISILILSGLAFWAGLFFISCRILTYFQSVELIGDLLARHLLSMVLLTLFSLLVFSHIVTALSNLYLSKDLEFYHSTPIGSERIFLSKAALTLVDSSWMLIVFGTPVFMAYAHVYKAGAIFYLSLLHMSVAMAVIAATIGILITVCLIAVFPARGTRDTVVLLSILLVIVLYLLLRFLRPERLVDPGAFFSVVQYLDVLKGTDWPYLPTHWITEALWSQLVDSSNSSQVFHVSLLWVTAASLVVINSWVASALYYEGFSRSQEAKQRRRNAKKVLDKMVHFLIRPLSQDVGALLAKDIRNFFRDNSQWSQLLLLGAIVVVYLYNFSVLPLDESAMRLDFLQNELAFVNMGLAGFVLAAIATRFVFPAVSAEGQAYWILQSSPIGLKRFFWEKFLFFLVPLLLLGEGLIVFTNYLLQVTPFMMVLSSGTMFLLVVGIIALGIGLGAVHPHFKHHNIAEISTGSSGIVYMIITALFVGIVVVLEAGPVYILFMAHVSGKSIQGLQWVFIVVCFSAVLLISGLTVYKPLHFGLKALEQYE